MVFFQPNFRPRRSALFLPASNLRAIAKAATLACDTLIFDLEDSVADTERDQARVNLLERVAPTDFGRREKVVRVSAISSPHFEGDVAAALQANPDNILLPKLEHAGHLHELRRRIFTAGGPSSPGLWAMIETPLGLLNLRDFVDAATETGLCGLVVGPNDLAKSTGVAMRPGRAAMIPWFMQVIAAARAGGMCVLDGVYNNFADQAGFGAECAQGVELGFDGKTLIHPSQIPAVNAAFAPSTAEFERARRIVAAYGAPENAGKGAIQIDGEMVERLHLHYAETLLHHEAMFKTETD